jgi:hypothetical protein
MPKLYRSAIHDNTWIACTPESGWTMFPAAVGGWEKRRPCRGLDPLYLREVPLARASDTGYLEWLEDSHLAHVA